jgi:hypothetical protein
VDKYQIIIDPVKFNKVKDASKSKRTEFWILSILKQTPDLIIPKFSIECDYYLEEFLYLPLDAYNSYKYVELQKNKELLLTSPFSEELFQLSKKYLSCATRERKKALKKLLGRDFISRVVVDGFDLRGNYFPNIYGYILNTRYVEAYLPSNFEDFI